VKHARHARRRWTFPRLRGRELGRNDSPVFTPAPLTGDLPRDPAARLGDSGPCPLLSERARQARRRRIEAETAVGRSFATDTETLRRVLDGLAGLETGRRLPTYVGV
jgi:hypothetical protein